MANKNKPDPGINAVQKIITLGMIGFMAYIFFNQDKNVKPVEEIAVVEPVNVIITDTISGNQIRSDLRAGKILIGKWEVELELEEEEDSLSIDSGEFLSEPDIELDEKPNQLPNQTLIPEIIEQ